MRNVLLILLALVTMSLDDTTRLQQAKQIAKTEQKLILIRFTGSDWCGPCKKMDRRVFQSDSFSTFAAKHLVQIEADFPKDKDLDGDVRKENKILARRFQKSQSYPYTVLLDADGKLLKTWKGYGGEYPTYYIDEIFPLVPRIVEPKPPVVQQPATDSTVIADSVSVRR